MKKLVLVFLLVSMLLGAAACSSAPGGVTVSDVWMRSANAGDNSAIYFVITNSGADDVLLSAMTDVTMMAELHKSELKDDGTVTMVPQENVPVPAKSTVELKPGDLHVMLMAVNKDLMVGEKIPVTLKFEKAGEIKVAATVKAP